MNAIILTGGLGTRLRPLTLTTPKALLPVLNTPFLSYQLAGLKKAGVKQIVLASGFQTRAFQRVLNPLWGEKITLRYAQEKKMLGTGGAIRFAWESIQDRRRDSEPVLILNGDILFDIDFKKLLHFHQTQKASATIALTQVPDASRFGVVSTKPSGRITRFLEKPKYVRGPRWINAGAYVFSSDLFQWIPTGRPVSVERETFPLYLAKGIPLFGFKTRGYWNDIGTPDTYLKAHRDLWKQKYYWTVNSFLRKRGALIGKKCRISSSVSFSGHVCVGDNVFIGPHVAIKNSVIFQGAKILAGAEVVDAIIGKNCMIGEHSKIGAGTVLGDNSKIPSFTRC